MLVEGFNFDFFGSSDWTVEVGNRETALECGALRSAPESGLFTLVENDWIEINLDPVVEIGDKAAERDPDLGEGEADTLWVFGRFDCFD